MTNHQPGDTWDDAPRQKKTYARPEIRQVALRADEAVLGTCKTGSGGTSGPGSGNCKSGVNPCSTLGS